jgi:hypothetical protein
MGAHDDTDAVRRVHASSSVRRDPQVDETAEIVSAASDPDAIPALRPRT